MNLLVVDKATQDSYVLLHETIKFQLHLEDTGNCTCFPFLRFLVQIYN